MLEMRAECEHCQTTLPQDADDAFICSYECTFCATCTQAMDGRCPNCGGDLRPRPMRTVAP